MALPHPHPSKSFWLANPSPLLTAHRSTRHLPPTTDICIIGSGITGASVAHHLLTSPTQNPRPDVLMLEAREACSGATGRNGGHLLPVPWAHPTDTSIGNFEMANFAALASLITERDISCDWSPQPGVRAIYSRHHLDEAEMALHTLPPELSKMLKLVTNRTELERLRIPTALGAVVTTTAAGLWPYRLVSRVLEDLVLGVEGAFNLQTATPVEGIVQMGDGWEVRTPRGTVKAGAVVVATNGYTAHVLPGFEDLIVPVRGQMSALQPVRGERRVGWNLGFEGVGIDDYLIQRPDAEGGELMFGGGRQKGGRTVGVSDDSVVDDEIAKYLRAALVEKLGLPTPKGVPELNATHEWTGIMGFSRDDLPWIGPVPDKPNLYMSAGYTGHGMPNAWLCGKAIARAIELKAAVPQQEDISTQRWREWDRYMAARVWKQVEQEVGVPKCYAVSEQRMKRAREAESVEVVDQAEMERARRRERADRMPSGYA